MTNIQLRTHETVHRHVNLVTLLTSTTASSRLEGRTLRNETVSSNRKTKLKVLLTKLKALLATRCKSNSEKRSSCEERRQADQTLFVLVF